MKFRKLLYLLPYFLILALGVWYRMHGSSLPFLDSDSGNYLLPPFIKKIVGEWHKGERPMVYLQFIYYTLSNDNRLNYTVFWQQLFSMTGACFLAGAWVVTVNKFKRPELLLHMAGYVLLLLYISSPQLMFYERFIGPEAISIALISVLIFCLTLIFSGNADKRAMAFTLSGAVFVNLYLSAYLNKWVFASVFVELLLLYLLLKKTDFTCKHNVVLLVAPHLFYVTLVTIPEQINKIDTPFESRLYISYKQMVYTHFNLLIKDKTNFELPPVLQDSLVQYFERAQQAQPDFLIGFDSDVLMWGKANDSVNGHFKNNFDSLNNFYRNLNWKLATGYTAELSTGIFKQAGAFFIPNQYVNKELYSIAVLEHYYRLSVHIAKELDRDLYNRVEPYWYSKKYPMLTKEKMQHLRFMAQRYPATMQEAGIYDTDKLPMLFVRYSLVFKWFDYYFLAAMLLFFSLKIYRKELLKPDANTLFYVLLVIYVFTVGIVHTFDIDRFIFTVYPLLLITTFMSGGYVCSSVWQALVKKYDA